MVVRAIQIETGSNLNLKTAKTLGLNISLPLLGRADPGDRMNGECLLLAQSGHPDALIQCLLLGE